LIRTFLAFALGLLVLAAPAHAADIATIGCIGDKVSPDLRARLAGDYEARLREPGRELDAALDDQLIAFGKECRARHGWSEAATNSAVAWTRSTIALPAAEKFARARGLDVDAVWRIWRATPAATRTRQLQDADLSVLGQALQAAGLFKKEGDPTIIGRLVAYMNTNEFCRVDFING